MTYFVYLYVCVFSFVALRRLWTVIVLMVNVYPLLLLKKNNSALYVQEVLAQLIY